MHHTVPPVAWVSLRRSAWLCIFSGRSAWTFPRAGGPGGGPGAASSVIRVKKCAKRSARLPFPCHYQRAPTSSSVSTSLGQYISHHGVMPASSFHEPLQPPRQYVRRNRGTVHRIRHHRHPHRQLLPSLGMPRLAYFHNGLQFCSKISHAVYQCLGNNKITTSFYHPGINGGA